MIASWDLEKKSVYKLCFRDFFMGYWPVVKKVVKDSDILLLVADARLPEISVNKELKEMVFKYGKRMVLVFTKRDLVSEKYLNFVMEKYKDSLFVSGTQNIGVAKLKEHLMIMAKRIGIKEPKIGIVGYPNVGKSAIINALAKRASAKVTAKAGTTKGIQWIRAGGLMILDSPGVVPFEDDEAILGVLGAKNPEKLRNPEKVGLEIIKMFLDYDKKVLEDLYGIEIIDPDTALEEIGKKKGLLLKGGVVDIQRAAMQVLRDWQKGRLKF